MAKSLSIYEAITDNSLDPEARTAALSRLGETKPVGNELDLLSTQLEKDIATDDHRFVIYLIGAIRRIFDRRAIELFTHLLTKDIDISFRSQCLAGLYELYRHSITHRLLGHIETSRLRLPEAGLIDENFVIHGTDLNDSDRQLIEHSLLAVVEDSDEAALLRDEARSLYSKCEEMRKAIQDNK